MLSRSAPPSRPRRHKSRSRGHRTTTVRFATTVYRKAKGDTSWAHGTVLAGSSDSLHRRNVVVGTAYEVSKSSKMRRWDTKVTATSSAALKPRWLKSAAKVILIVEKNRHATALANELARLQSDLTGRRLDGHSPRCFVLNGRAGNYSQSRHRRLQRRPHESKHGLSVWSRAGAPFGKSELRTRMERVRCRRAMDLLWRCEGQLERESRLFCRRTSS